MTRFSSSATHLRLADRDERLLHRNCPQVRTIEAPRSGQEDTMRFATTMEGLLRRQSDQCRADALGLPSCGLMRPLQQCHGAAADRLDPLSPVFGRSDLVGARNRRAGAHRHPAARDRVFTRGRSGYRKSSCREDDPARAGSPRP